MSRLISRSPSATTARRISERVRRRKLLGAMPVSSTAASASTPWPSAPLRYDVPQSLLVTDGYAVLRGVVRPRADVVQWLRELATESGGPIFGRSPMVNDGRRRQVTLADDSEFIVGALGASELFEHPIFADVQRPTTFNALLSERNCQEQAGHCDFDPASARGRSSLAVTISLQDGGRLDVWPQSHLVARQNVPASSSGDGGAAPMDLGNADDDHDDTAVVEAAVPTADGTPRWLLRQLPLQRQRVYLNAGDAVVFVGNLVHAGSQYDDEHLRVHCYCDARGYVRAKDDEDEDVTHFQSAYPEWFADA